MNIGSGRGELNKARSISIFLNHSNGVRSSSSMRFGRLRTFLKFVHKQVSIKLYGKNTKRTRLAVTKQMDCNKIRPTLSEPSHSLTTQGMVVWP